MHGSSRKIQIQGSHVMVTSRPIIEWTSPPPPMGEGGGGRYEDLWVLPPLHPLRLLRRCSHRPHRPGTEGRGDFFGYCLFNDGLLSNSRRRAYPVTLSHSIRSLSTSSRCVFVSLNGFLTGKTSMNRSATLIPCRTSIPMKERVEPFLSLRNRGVVSMAGQELT